MGACCNKPYVKNETTPRVQTISRKSSIFLEHFSKQSDYKKKYEYISTLGSGGFGKVRLFRDKRNPNMKFAIKTIKKDYLNKHAMVSLVREVNILRQLDHPNIVNYFETCEDEPFINIVMEYIPGDNLLKMISNKTYKEFGERVILAKLSLFYLKQYNLCIITTLSIATSNQETFSSQSLGIISPLK